MRKNGHHDKANDKESIEISANTNTLKSEVILRINNAVDIRQNNSIDSLVGFKSNSTHQELTSLKIRILFLLPTAN